MASKQAVYFDPIDRNAEILFGLFMALTFTGTLSVATAGRHDVRLVLIAAIGCILPGGLSMPSCFCRVAW